MSKLLQDCLGYLTEKELEAIEVNQDFLEKIRMKKCYMECTFWLHKSNSFLDNNQLENAIYACEIVLKLDPNNFYAINNIGRAYKRKGEYQKAKKMFKQTIKLAPMFHHGYIDLSKIYILKRKYMKALKMAEKALEIRPDNYKAWYYCGQIYQEMGKTDESLKHYIMAIKTDQWNKSHFTLNDAEIWHRICEILKEKIINIDMKKFL